MKIEVLAISASHSRYHLEEEQQRATWAKQKSDSVSVSWIKADPLLKAIVADNHQNIFVPGSENFENILSKRISSINWVLKNRVFDYLVLTNSSAYIAIENLLDFLGENKHPDFVGGYVNFQPSKENAGILQAFLNGGFSLLGKGAARELAQLDPRNFAGIPDDVAMSLHLRNAGYSFVPVRIANIAEGQRFALDLPYYRIRHIKYPKITRIRMKELHEIHSGHHEGIKKFIWKESWRMVVETQEYQRSVRRALSFSKSLL